MNRWRNESLVIARREETNANKASAVKPAHFETSTPRPYTPYPANHLSSRCQPPSLRMPQSSIDIPPIKRTVLSPLTLRARHRLLPRAASRIQLCIAAGILGIGRGSRRGRFFGGVLDRLGRRGGGGWRLVGDGVGGGLGLVHVDGGHGWWWWWWRLVRGVRSVTGGCDSWTDSHVVFLGGSLKWRSCIFHGRCFFRAGGATTGILCPVG